VSLWLHPTDESSHSLLRQKLFQTKFSRYTEIGIKDFAGHSLQVSIPPENIIHFIIKSMILG